MALAVDPPEPVIQAPEPAPQVLQPVFQPSGGSASVEQEAEHLLAVGVLDVSLEVANAAMRHDYGALDARDTGRGGGGAGFDERIEESGCGKHTLSCSMKF